MSAVDAVVSTLPKTGLSRFEGERIALFTDGDHTLFEPNSTNLYLDAQIFLENIVSEVTVLVSANPDEHLAKERAAILGAEYAIPRRTKWIKAGLFSRAIGMATNIAEFDRAVVLGDRFLMDVLMGKLAFKDADIPAFGVLVRRPETRAIPPTRFDKLVLRPLEKAGYIAVSTMHFDSFFRPKTTDLEAAQ